MTEVDIKISDAEITERAKLMAKKCILADREKIAARQAEKEKLKHKKAAEKAEKAAITKARNQFLTDLPKFFAAKLNIAITKNMEQYLKNPETRWLDRLYKLAVIKRELLGGNS